MPQLALLRGAVRPVCASALLLSLACGRLGFEAHLAATPGKRGGRDASAGDGRADLDGATGSGSADGGANALHDGGSHANGPDGGDTLPVGDGGGNGATSDAGSVPQTPRPWPGGTFPEECGGAASANWLACMDFGTSSSGTADSLNGTVDAFAASPGQSGAVALYASVGQGGYAMCYADFPSQLSGTLYLRAYFYVVSGPVMEDVTLLSLEASGGGTQVVALDVHQNDQLVFYHEASSTDFPTGFTFPRDTWTCLTARIGIGNSGAITISADGVPQLTQSGLDLLPQGGVGHVSVGLPWTHDQQTTVEVYTDSVVVDDAPVDCL